MASLLWLLRGLWSSRYNTQILRIWSTELVKLVEAQLEDPGLKAIMKIMPWCYRRSLRSMGPVPGIEHLTQKVLYASTISLLHKLWTPKPHENMPTF